MITGQDVADFVGRGTDPETVAAAGEIVPIITAMCRAYCRGRGFTDDQPADDLQAVITTASARMLANPGQLTHTSTIGPFTETVTGGFTGWTLAELFVLNRYRATAS